MSKRFLTILAILFCTCSAKAQLFTGFDINPGNKDAYPKNFIEMNGKLFFTARTDSFGRELYVSDGTPAGTKMVKDLWKGPADGIEFYAENFVVLNGRIIFSGSDGMYAGELWSTDGTEAGTYIINPVMNHNFTIPKNLTVCNNRVYYITNDHVHGNELWSTDGTLMGTDIVADINPGVLSSDPKELTAFNGALYFSAGDAVNGRELWLTYGTATGTGMLVDLSTTSGGSFPNHLMVLGNELYFFANPTSNKSELWKTNGTPIGTAALVNNVSFFISGKQQYLVSGNKLYFTAFSPTGRQIWVTDGSTATTFALPVTYKYADIDVMAAYDGKVYVSGLGANNDNELWVTDGTATGTKVVDDVPNGMRNPGQFKTYKDHLYFSGNPGSAGYGLNLCRTDGLAVNMVAPHNSTNKEPLYSTVGSSFFEFFVYNSSLYLAANFDTAQGIDLWSFKDTPVVNNITQQITTKHNNLTIYPNPNNGDFTLELPAGIIGDATVTVYDITGRCVYTQSITTNNHKHSLSLNVPAGTYRLQLSAGGETTGKLFVIQ